LRSLSAVLNVLEERYLGEPVSYNLLLVGPHQGVEALLFYLEHGHDAVVTASRARLASEGRGAMQRETLRGYIDDSGQSDDAFADQLGVPRDLLRDESPSPAGRFARERPRTGHSRRGRLTVRRFALKGLWKQPARW
jgi:hypothetical protein